MDDDITRAYREKLRRDAMASQFAHEIQSPHRNPHRSAIETEDLEALAMAVERSTPDQVAHWIQTLLYYACAEDVFDDAESGGAWEDDTQDGGGWEGDH